MKDRELTRLLQTHPEEGLEAAMLAYAPLVKAVLNRILPQNPCDREECMADVFVSLWRNAAKLERTATPLRPWLLVTARNKGIDRYNALRRREALREYLDVARDEQDRDARFEQTVKARATLLGFHSFYIARFYLAHDLNAVGVKIIKKAGKLKTGTVYVVLCDFDLFKALRAVYYLKIKFVDQVSQAHAKFFKLHMGSPFRNISYLLYPFLCRVSTYSRLASGKT